MPRSSAPSRSLRSRTDSFELISAPPKHPVMRVVGLLVRLRAEITVLAVALAVWFTLRHNLSLLATIAVCVVLVGLLAGLPCTRRYCLRRATAVMTRHRLRQTLVECRVVNFSRNCPVFLWSRPTRVGEIVWLVLRAGISVDDVADRAPEIAAGCFAREARVTARTSMAALVRVEVIRRDPLAPAAIDSELGPWAVGWDSPVIPVGATPVVPATRDSGRSWVIDAPASEPVPAYGRPDAPAASTEATTKQDGAEMPVGRAGDWSDYV